ncbi:MAG: hypothetical protein MI748_03765, partial [Opitutales bacterium]|nr:hypothetical protein [Opitutales bacterium]
MKKLLMVYLVMVLVSVAGAGYWTHNVGFDITADLQVDGILLKASNFGSVATIATVKGIEFNIDWSNTNSGVLAAIVNEYYA